MPGHAPPCFKCLGFLLFGLLGWAGSAWAQADKEFVDLELVLAVDVSLSMDLDEQRLQREFGGNLYHYFR